MNLMNIVFSVKYDKKKTFQEISARRLSSFELRFSSIQCAEQRSTGRHRTRTYPTMLRRDDSRVARENLL